MKGCRPLSRHERKLILAACKDDREHALFCLGVATGYRISELLSLSLGDVVDAQGTAKRYVSVKAQHTKTGEGRTVVLGASARRIVGAYAGNLIASGTSPTSALFPSRQGGRISRSQAHRILKALYDRAGVNGGTLATHCMRKSFASEIYEATGGKLEKVQIALGHRSITSTVQYLMFKQDEIDLAIETLEV